MKAGFIGTGVMGRPMAHNVLKAGHSLVVFDIQPEQVKDLVDAGATLAQSPADLAARCEALFLSLPADPEVEAVMLGPEGVIAGAGPGTVVIDTTSGTPHAARRMEAAASARQVGYLDAPVSGGVKGAREGTLTLMVGGDGGAVGKVRSLLTAVGRNIYEVGPVGAGRTLKAINQIIAGLNAAILCESLVLAKKAGISAETFLEVLGNTAADSYQLQTKLPQFIIPRKFDGGFRINLMLKDLDIAMEMARQLQAPALISSLGTQLYRAAARSGYGQKDTSSMVQFLSSLGGVDF